MGEILATHPDRCEAWISSAGQAPPPPHSPPHLTWFQLDPGLFDELDVSGTHAPLLLIRLPEIPEVDYKKVKLEKLVVKADDKSVDEALKSLADTAKSFDDRKKGSKAKDGDQVVIDFLGKLGGEPFEGGAAEDYPLVLGSNSFIPGFEDQLVGVKAGEEVATTGSFLLKSELLKGSLAEEE